jgi:octaheme c-type cytochrome (tetrathionate reductase family)
MWKKIIAFIITIIAVLVLANYLVKDVVYNLKLEQLKQEYAIKPVSSIDHTKLEILQQKFATPQEVTAACNTCHTERHKEIMNSSHWNWERISYIEGRGIASVGKKNALNNFCIGSGGNEQSCAKCHIGFGMSNNHYDFTNKLNVDCMVCHDNSDEYLKGSSMAGYPDRSVNLTKVAQSVGKPTKINCGSCHFYSGGGNNVKHGDLEEALLACERDIDVHMAANGMDLSCVDCHTAENHKMLGKLYSVSSTNNNRSTCVQCHTAQPHFNDLLNKHFAKVSCQACHIPEYAKVNATKMAWKWSEAGQLKEGEAYEQTDSLGNIEYMSIKGSFVWKKNVKPDYQWFNGTADHYLLGDTITPSDEPIKMNTLFGNHADGKSKIIPVKIHYGDQIYDPKTKLLIQPKLYAEHKGDSAYWKDFDWDNASKAGMDRIGLPYSGEHKFVETTMYWPINHMVAPKDKSVSCVECHTRNNGRLAKLNDFYLPGRDYNKLLDRAGGLLLLLSLIGVVVHSLIRIIISIKNKEIEEKNISYDKD